MYKQDSLVFSLKKKRLGRSSKSFVYAAAAKVSILSRSFSDCRPPPEEETESYCFESTFPKREKEEEEEEATTKRPLQRSCIINK